MDSLEGLQAFVGHGCENLICSVFFEFPCQIKNLFINVYEKSVSYGVTNSTVYHH